MFLHPTESVHGDLGIVSSNDVAILISKSGETEELLPLLEQLKRLGVRTVAITGEGASTLARHSDVWLDASVREEACPHDLAPTTSTTVTLALGDALAVTLLEVKGFRREDFARLHPGGALGKRLLLTRARRHGDGPSCRSSRPARRCARPWCSWRNGAASRSSRTRPARCSACITTGDLTRLMEREADFLAVARRRRDDACAEDRRARRARAAPSSTGWSRPASWRCPSIDAASRVVGVVHLHDLMRAGAV